MAKRVGKKKEDNQVLFYLVAILLIIAVGIFIYNIGKFYGITGNATGTANLTISQITSINFTTSNISWGVGEVTDSADNATLDTSAGTVVNGNWTAVSQGFIVENIGNQNVTIDLSTGKAASTFIDGYNGSVFTDADYRFNVSSNEAGSCVNASYDTASGSPMSGIYNLSHFFNVNATSPGLRVCDLLYFDDAKDTMRIDLYLNISADSATTGTIEDTITATATAVS